MKAAATSAPASTLLVRKQITVKAPPARAFRIFTEKHGSWWPLATHHTGAVDAVDAVIEPRVGGRWYEKGVDGSECEWGRVQAWEPPSRLVLVWQTGADWKFDPNLHTEVEIRFDPTTEGHTLLTLEHRHLEAFGEAAPAMQAAFESEQGWSGLLAIFAAAAGAETA
ncbi:MAG TPA: SRPBCC family protein [Azospirillaceae bacterium]|nr:SRPBCC family protein [Azospirillaceae bacterium]